MQFLSTPSARRATICPLLGPHRRPISIHALREEGDDGKLCLTLLLPLTAARSSIFLSTPSARRATHPALRRHRILRISIHALREEGDIAVQHILERDANFYPRPPRGGRHLLSTALGTPTDFYPRPPRGGRRISPSLARDSRTFLSTPSARRATQHQHRKRLCWCISIHALREEGDSCILFEELLDLISIHALREEGDDLRHKGRARGSNFYPRPPRGGRLSFL